MARTTLDTWDANFFHKSPMFQALLPFSREFEQFSVWPELSDLKTLFSLHGMDMTPVAQAEKPACFEDYYEPRIFLKRELQTRRENWHDLFNALVWLRFPQAKSELNKLHYQTAVQRQAKTNRSPQENAITLFDESGIIVISDNAALLQLIREHQWRQLFVQHREDFANHIRCIVFGHALYEKALSPYIGMTAQALLIQSDELLSADISLVDEHIAHQWQQHNINSPKCLSPLPVLGIPGWYADNEQEIFYDNKDYFRDKRK